MKTVGNIKTDPNTKFILDFKITSFSAPTEVCDIMNIRLFQSLY